MTTRTYKSIAGVLATLASMSVAHAGEDTIFVQPVTAQHQAILNDLLSQGLIVNLPDQENWYQINQKRLMEYAAQGDSGLSTAETVDLLKSLIGDDVHISVVNVANAVAGTQDVKCSAKVADE